MIKINFFAKGVSITIVATIVFLAALFLPHYINEYGKRVTGAFMVQHIDDLNKGDFDREELIKKVNVVERKGMVLMTSFFLSLLIFVLLSVARRTELILINNSTFRFITIALLFVGLVTFTFSNAYIDIEGFSYRGLKKAASGSPLIYAFIVLVLSGLLYLVGKIYKIVNEREMKQIKKMPRFPVSFYKIITIADFVIILWPLLAVLVFIISQYCYLAFVKMMKYQSDNSYNKWIVITLMGTVVSIITSFVMELLFIIGFLVYKT